MGRTAGVSWKRLKNSVEMIMPNLGKILFPHLPPDLRRRRMSVLLITGMVSVTLAALMALVMAKLGVR
jgi:hypothetical protein